jgi:3-oxoacyl-[acyl-carrier protein] reductase
MTQPTDGTGRIINVTSAAGLTGTLGQVNYSAAKAGIIGLTRSIAMSSGGRRRRTNFCRNPLRD